MSNSVSVYKRFNIMADHHNYHNEPVFSNRKSIDPSPSDRPVSGLSQAMQAGERGVVSGGDIEASTIVTGDNNFVQVVKKYIHHPPTLYADLRRFLQQCYRLLTCLAVTEIGLAMLFYQYKDRYLVAEGVYLFLAVLSAAVIWCWGGVVRRPRQPIS